MSFFTTDRISQNVVDEAGSAMGKGPNMNCLTHWKWYVLKFKCIDKIID